MSQKNRVIKKQTFEFTSVSANAWQTFQTFRELGKSGRITRVVTRMKNGGTGAAGAIVRVVDGQYTAAYSVANIGAIPDEDVVLHRSGITLLGAISAANDDYNVEAVAGGAFYSAEQQRRSDPKTRDKDEALISLFVPAGCSGDVVVTLYAEVR